MWIYGSRAKGNHKLTSDLDIAIDIEAVGSDESPMISYINMAAHWRSELKPIVPFEVDLEWWDPSNIVVSRGVDSSGVLVYERAV
jgi:predicted nucleotidyltransferase